MVADIESVLEQILSIRQDAPGIAADLSDEEFNWQPAPGRWSVGQCLEHLNITASKYLPVLDDVIDRARAAGRLAPGPFAYGFIEQWFTRRLEPPVTGGRTRAPAAFQPAAALSRDAVFGRFMDLQEELAARARKADGLDLRRVKVRSPFGPISFSLGQTFQGILAHERRHLWQARQVRSEMEGIRAKG